MSRFLASTASSGNSYPQPSVRLASYIVHPKDQSDPQPAPPSGKARKRASGSLPFPPSAVSSASSCGPPPCPAPPTRGVIGKAPASPAAISTSAVKPAPSSRLPHKQAAAPRSSESLASAGAPLRDGVAGRIRGNDSALGDSKAKKKVTPVIQIPAALIADCIISLEPVAGVPGAVEIAFTWQVKVKSGKQVRFTWQVKVRVRKAAQRFVQRLLQQPIIEATGEALPVPISAVIDPSLRGDARARAIATMTNALSRFSDDLEEAGLSDEFLVTVRNRGKRFAGRRRSA